MNDVPEAEKELHAGTINNEETPDLAREVLEDANDAPESAVDTSEVAGDAPKNYVAMETATNVPDARLVIPDGFPLEQDATTTSSKGLDDATPAIKVVNEVNCTDIVCPRNMMEPAGTTQNVPDAIGDGPGLFGPKRKPLTALNRVSDGIQKLREPAKSPLRRTRMKKSKDSIPRTQMLIRRFLKDSRTPQMPIEEVPEDQESS